MAKKIGFLGCGNMGGAMLKGILASKIASSHDIYIYDTNKAQMDSMSTTYPGICICEDPYILAENADLIVLAIKPNMYEDIVCDIRDSVKDDVVMLSIAAGIGISSIQKWFKRDVRVVRTMPNTPALVMKGMTAVSYSESVKASDMEFVKQILSSFSMVEEVPENLMDAVPAVSGSSPAYVFMMIEAMGDAAVCDGIPREQAYRMAAQAVLGAATMMLETGMHPGALKDMVTSPAGTTIEAVMKLEEKGFKHAINEAMRVCTEKSEEMSKKYNK